MSKRLCVAGALGAGLLMTVVAAGSAMAVPLAKMEVPMPGVTLVRGHGHGGMGHGGMGGHVHMGGMGRSFHFHGGPHFGHRGHFGRGVRFYGGYGYYAPYYNSYYYDNDYYAYSDDCGWLRRRALHTNSRYWWRRYRACRDSY